MLIQNLHIECCFVLLFTVYEYSQYKIFLLIMKTQMCLVFMSKLIKLKDNNFSPILSYNTLKLIFYSNMTPNPVFNGRNGFSILKNSHFYMSHLYIWTINKKVIQKWKKRTTSAAILDFFRWL